MKVSIIIPAYNEEKTVGDIIKKVSLLKLDKEIIVVDDGSTDKTISVLNKLKEKYHFKIIKHKTNKGKGFAIRSGLKATTGEIIAIQDADLELNPQDLLKLVDKIERGATVVYGARFLENPPKISILSWFGNFVVTYTTNILYGINISDEATGYKVFRKKILKDITLKCEKFEFCPEITAKIAKKKIHIYEVPVSFKPRTKKEGKKINWKDGIHAVWILIKYRFID